MPTKQEIDQKYIAYHDNLTNKYKNGLAFEGRILSSEEFEKMHTLNWLNHEKEIVDNSYDSPPPGITSRTVSEINSAITTETNREVLDISEETSDLTYNVNDR